MSAPAVFPLPPAQWDGTDRRAGSVPQSGPLGLVLRALVAVALVLAWAGAQAEPAERPLYELYEDLDAGRVDTVTFERPEEVWTEGSGTFRVEWTGADGSSWSTYTFAVSADPENPAIDEADIVESLAEQSPEPVQVVRHAGRLPSWSAPAWLVVASLVGGLGTILLIVGGPAPRLATRWAWFWLAPVPLAWLGFVLLEPGPAWRRRPSPVVVYPLRGGLAFVIGLVAVPIVHSVTWLRPFG